jgi:hypothetical protein
LQNAGKGIELNKEVKSVLWGGKTMYNTKRKSICKKKERITQVKKLEDKRIKHIEKDKTGGWMTYGISSTQKLA